MVIIKVTYPGADLAQTAAVHLLSPGHVGEGEVDLSPLAGEHLVTQGGLLGRLAQLEGGLDLPHVGEIGIDAVRLQDGVDHVVSLEEGACDGSVIHLAVQLVHTHRAEMTEVEKVLLGFEVSDLGVLLH